MYQPPLFRETDLGVQHDLIESHPLGLLISTGVGGILANPIPFILYPAEGSLGTLRCHMARANAQWQALQQNPDALIVFQGTQHYISPSWYAQKAIDHKVVPTWNYAMVQARGTAKIIEDAAWLHANVSALTGQHEGHRHSPWAVTDAPEAFIASQLKGIVGVEIEISHLDGKFKASQNRPVADRHGVIEGLASEPDPEASGMRDLVKQRGGL
jgi:transcriptional regulator